METQTAETKIAETKIVETKILETNMAKEPGFDNLVFVTIEDEKKVPLDFEDDVTDSPPSYTDEDLPKDEKKIDKFDVKNLDFADTGPSWSG